MKPVLRPYQCEAHAAVFDALMEDYKSVLITAATGTGKTLVAAEIIRTFLSEYGWKVLYLAPRKELIGQAYKKVRDMCGLYDGIDVDKEQGDNHFDKRARVVIGSRQTCYKETRLQGWIPDVIIVDEAHEGACPQIQAIFKRFPEAIRIGVSIGPDTRLCIRNVHGHIENLSIAALSSRYNLDQEQNAPVHGLEIQSIDQDGSLRWFPISRIWRFKNKKRTLEISTQLGRKLIVTEDHSVFSLDSHGNIELKLSSDLVVGDYLVAEPFLQTPNPKVSTIPVWQYCDPCKTRVGNIPLSVVMNATKGNPKLRYKAQRGVYGNNLLLETALSMGLIPTKDHILYTEASSGNWFPAVVKTCSIAWLIGYIAGDGWSGDRKIGLAVRNEHAGYIYQMLSNLPGKHGIQERQYEGALNLALTCHPLWQMIDYWFFGKKAHLKRLPKEIFQWDQKSRQSVIAGLIDSDGHKVASLGRNQKGVVYVTTSYGLAQDINYLLCSLGSLPAVSERLMSKPAPNQTSSKNRKSYRIAFSERSIDGTWVGHRKCTSERNRALVSCSDATCLKITNIQEVDGIQDVYDLSIPGVERFFAGNMLVHNTATAMRGDRKPVFAENMDGSMFMVQDAITRKPKECMVEEAAFHKHIYNYELKQAVPDGWLVEPHGYKVTTKVDISQVKSTVNTEGDFDFSQAGLNAVLEADQQVIVDRINAAISKWKEVASDRPTLVFCSSVEYAKWAAKLWADASYTSQAIDANTNSLVRDEHIEEIHKGNVQVTTNFGIYTHGTDVDKWSCIVMLRPTKSPGLYMQMLGRGTRPLDAVGYELGRLPGSAERLEAISNSLKGDTIIIDVVDICGKHEICTLPTALGLPASLDLQGKGLMQAAPVVAEYEKNKEQVMEEGCPATYQELEATLSRIELLNTSGAHRGNWLISENGSYYYGKAPPGYLARLSRMQGEGIERWNLQVVACGTGEVLVDNTAPRRTGDIRDYFNSAAARAERAIHDYMDKLPKVPTWDKLSQQEKYYMTSRCKLTKREVNQLSLDQCRDKIKVQRRKYWAQKGKQQ